MQCSSRNTLFTLLNLNTLPKIYLYSERLSNKSHKTFRINLFRQCSALRNSNTYVLGTYLYVIHECLFKGYFCLQLYRRSLTFQHVYLSAAFGIFLFLHTHSVFLFQQAFELFTLVDYIQLIVDGIWLTTTVQLLQ